MRLMSSNDCPHCKTNYGESAECANCGHPIICGCPVNTDSYDEWYERSYDRWIGRFEKYRNNNTEINEKDAYGEAPIHHAVGGYLGSVEALIEAGANVNIIDDETESTPLHHIVPSYYGTALTEAVGLTAIRYTNMKKAEALINAGADVNVQDCKKRTPIQLAISMGEVGVFKALLNAGADLNTIDKWGNTPIHGAIWSRFILRTLIDNDSNVNARNHDGEIPLYVAAQHARQMEIEDLLGAGADVNATTRSGLTPLHIAASHHNYYSQHSAEESIKILLKAGAIIDKADPKGRTPIHYAAQHGEVEAIEELVNAGADVNVGDIEKITPIHLAAKEYWSGDIVSPNPEKTQPHMKQGVGKIEALIKAGADVNARDIDKQTPLHHAWEDIIIDILVKNGADIDAKDKKNLTPLHRNAGSPRDEYLNTKMLLELGANVNARDRYHRSPLHHATRRPFCNEDLVKLLIDAGAEVDAKDRSNHTPLYYANKKDHDSICKLLIKYGANRF